MSKVAWIDGYWTGIKLNYTTLSENFHFIKYSIQIGMKYYKNIYTCYAFIFEKETPFAAYEYRHKSKQTTANKVITVYTAYIEDCCDIIAPFNIENKIPVHYAQYSL